MVQEGCVHALETVLVGEEGEPEMLTRPGEFFGLPYRASRQGREVLRRVGELGFFYGREVGSVGRVHGGVVIRVSRGLL